MAAGDVPIAEGMRIGCWESAAALVMQSFKVMLGKHATWHWYDQHTWRGRSRLSLVVTETPGTLLRMGEFC